VITSLWKWIRAWIERIKGGAVTQPQVFPNLDVLLWHLVGRQIPELRLVNRSQPFLNWTLIGFDRQAIFIQERRDMYKVAVLRPALVWINFDRAGISSTPAATAQIWSLPEFLASLRGGTVEYSTVADDEPRRATLASFNEDTVELVDVDQATQPRYPVIVPFSALSTIGREPMPFQPS